MIFLSNQKTRGMTGTIVPGRKLSIRGKGVTPLPRDYLLFFLPRGCAVFHLLMADKAQLLTRGNPCHEHFKYDT